METERPIPLLEQHVPGLGLVPGIQLHCLLKGYRTTPLGNVEGNLGSQEFPFHVNPAARCFEGVRGLEK